ncbi:MAG: hypothetical protein AAGJ46_11865 [Planctomycetota bacterium]
MPLPDNDSTTASTSDENAFHPVIYAAVVPTIGALFGVAAYVNSVREQCSTCLNNFEVELPRFTEMTIALTANPLVVFTPPALLTAVMIWYAHRRPMTHALCVVFGSLALGLAAASAAYVAMVWPLLSLISELA